MGLVLAPTTLRFWICRCCMVLAFVSLRCGRVNGLLSRRLLLPPPRIDRYYDIGATKLRSTFTTQSSLEVPKVFNTSWLDVELPEGRCIGVELSGVENDDQTSITPENLKDKNHWVHSVYHPDEVAYGMKLKSASSSSFWMGRMAMRIALDFPDYPILKDSFGRPQLSPGVCGSISHKGNKGVALVSVASNQTLSGVGVDLELTQRPGKKSIAGRILTQREQESLGRISGLSEDQEVLLRFSLKEAIYKAAHPLLCQYVGFQEAEVTPHEDGTATCDWFLESRADDRIGHLTAHWRILENEGYFLTSASVEAKDN